MDMDAGASPFGHASLIYSKQEQEYGPIEVVDSMGYYSQPSTSTNPVIKYGKLALGLGVDLQDGHGVHKQEAMRYLNLENGLKGISFPATKQQFEDCLQEYRDIVILEERVIKELDDELVAKNITPNGQTRFQLEKEKAAAEMREPRLKPFHITMDMNQHGFDSSASYTCKDRALALLENQKIITNDIKERILSSRTEKAFPRFSALALYPIRLLVTGSLVPQVSKSKQVTYYNPEWNHNHLYWVSPLVTLDKTSIGVAESNEQAERYHTVTFMLRRIARMEARLHKKIDSLRAQDNKPDNLKELELHLARVEALNELFSNIYDNNIPEKLQEQRSKANKVLRCANAALHPEKLSQTYRQSKEGHSSDRNILLGITISFTATVLIAASAFILGMATVLSLLVIPVITMLFTAMLIYNYIQNEKRFNQNQLQSQKEYSEFLDKELNRSPYPEQDYDVKHSYEAPSEDRMTQQKQNFQSNSLLPQTPDSICLYEWNKSFQAYVANEAQTATKKHIIKQIALMSEDISITHNTTVFRLLVAELVHIMPRQALEKAQQRYQRAQNALHTYSVFTTAEAKYARAKEVNQLFGGRHFILSCGATIYYKFLETLLDEITENLQLQDGLTLTELKEVQKKLHHALAHQSDTAQLNTMLDEAIEQETISAHELSTDPGFSLR